MTGTNYFWNETMLGKMIPFTPVVYYNDELKKQAETYIPGFTPISIKQIKFANNDDPMKLVYSSPSFTDETIGYMTGVLVYEINKKYNPNLES